MENSLFVRLVEKQQLYRVLYVLYVLNRVLYRVRKIHFEHKLHTIFGLECFFLI